MIEPITITRLKALGPGETFVYYKGNFANDISRSLSVDNISIKPATQYVSLLKYIQETAKDLERQNRVKISQSIVELPSLPPLRSVKGAYENYLIEYIATGI